MGERERILLADDLSFTREGMRETIELFGEEDGHQVVGEASSLAQVEELLKGGLRPTLAIIDANMPNRGDGEKAAAVIRQISPETKIVSHSSQLQTWGDVNWVKGELLARELVEQINKL